MKHARLIIMASLLAAYAAEAKEQQMGQRARFNGRALDMREEVAAVGIQRNATHEPFAEPLTAVKIRRAIDDGIRFLRSRQNPDGSIGHESYGGGTALAVLAMLAAGADPASDAALRKAMDWLAAREVDHTYTRAIRANAWEYALRKVPYDQGVKDVLKKDCDWLMKARGSSGVWRYTMNPGGDWDNSCSQYGVLGIWAAARAGLDPGDAFWKDMSRHFLGCQNADGGWGYQKSGSTANMATAGLASMFLVFDMYHGKSFYTADGSRRFSSGEAAQCLQSIERGMAWLGKNGLGSSDSYFLYGIERVGVASGRKYIGGRDWFKEGALVALKAQQGSGAFALQGHGDDVTRTSFTVLFLVYGGAPVAYNKLEYGDDHDWDLNPRDLANLCKDLWSAYEQPLNWHSVSIGAPVEEFEAPLLFISGSRAAEFKDAEVEKLRQYVLRGGTIVAEPSDHSKTFRESMVALVGRMFPAKDYPACTLEPIAADHGVYSVLKQEWKNKPRLSGVSDGSRTFFFLSDGYLSADWQMNRTDSDAFKLGMNLLFYATDLGVLQGKFASVTPETPAAPERKTVASVARVRHAGSGRQPSDWTAGATSWKAFAPYFKHVTGRTLEEKKAIDLASDSADGVHLLHLTGRGELNLSPAEQKALKRYVEKGGTVLVDAYAGSREFAASARKEIEGLFGKLQPLDAGSMLATGRFQGGADLTRGLRMKLPARRAVSQAGRSPQGQQLEVVDINARPAVIFSSLDLSAALAGIENYESLGYKQGSAMKIACNVLALITAD